MALKQPILVPHAAEDTYELTRDYRLEVEGVTVVVPRFFRFDGASIPAAAWVLTYPPFHPDVMLPSLVHDWMYYNHQETREKTDDIFFALLRGNGVSRLTANGMWAAVRAGGGIFWNNDEEDIAMLIRLCRKTHGRPNFKSYKFPAKIRKLAGRFGGPL